MNVWQQAIDDELINAHLGVAGNVTLEEAKKAIKELIQVHIDIATDPAVNGGRSLQSVQPAVMEPVLIVEVEPDYWSGGHFYTGKRPYISHMQIQKLAIGTKLFTHPSTNHRDTLDAARYRWLRDISVPPHNFYLSVPEEFSDEKYSPGQVDIIIDAAMAAQHIQGGV